MSCGIGHMCITMGIAEAIAITTIVTASNFAIWPRLWPGLTRPYFESTYVLSTTLGSLLRFKSEIGFCSRAGGYGNFLRLGAGGFLPRGYGVVTGRHIIDGVGAVRVAGGVRPFYYGEPTMHPGMDVALYFDHLRSLPA